MPFTTSPYLEQARRWPQNGRVILARDLERLQTPTETVYPVTNEDVAFRLGLDHNA